MAQRNINKAVNHTKEAKDEGSLWILREEQVREIREVTVKINR